MDLCPSVSLTDSSGWSRKAVFGLTGQGALGDLQGLWKLLALGI
jgi:hypothetical protein